GGQTGEADLVDISSSVESINQLFTGCRCVLHCEEDSQDDVVPGADGGIKDGEFDPSQLGTNLTYLSVPNPFWQSTTIQLALPEISRVSLRLYSVRGQLITELVDEIMSPGQTIVTLDLTKDRSIPAGTHFLRLRATGVRSGQQYVETHKVLVVR
ncbi:T9SS type A sorting domain-containing protein, partial [Candidatus Eisenbacteria bacterium]